MLDSIVTPSDALNALFFVVGVATAIRVLAAIIVGIVRFMFFVKTVIRSTCNDKKKR